MDKELINKLIANERFSSDLLEWHDQRSTGETPPESEVQQLAQIFIRVKAEDKSLDLPTYIPDIYELAFKCQYEIFSRMIGAGDGNYWREELG